jgi:hypothetical protein
MAAAHIQPERMIVMVPKDEGERGDVIIIKKRVEWISKWIW